MLGKHSEPELDPQLLTLSFLEGFCLCYVVYIWQEEVSFYVSKGFFWQS